MLVFYFLCVNGKAVGLFYLLFWAMPTLTPENTEIHKLFGPVFLALVALGG